MSQAHTVGGLTLVVWQTGSRFEKAINHYQNLPFPITFDGPQVYFGINGSLVALDDLDSVELTAPLSMQGGSFLGAAANASLSANIGSEANNSASSKAREMA